MNKEQCKSNLDWCEGLNINGRYNVCSNCDNWDECQGELIEK